MEIVINYIGLLPMESGVYKEVITSSRLVLELNYQFIELLLLLLDTSSWKFLKTLSWKF
jgi:hypothetical protein